MNLVELGQRIKELREKRALKQRDVANALQISAQAVSKWERGENAPDIAILLDLSKLLGVSTDALLGRKEKEDDTFAATVFCTDMKGFAARAASLPPREVAAWANGLFNLLTGAVVRFDGVPVKYVGDGFLAFFSGPNHAARAVKAAQAAKTLVPEVTVSLHTGDIYLGLIGHTEYARPDIIGDTVNTAFLVLSWAAKNLPEGVSLTEAVVNQLTRDNANVALSPARLASVPLLKKKLKVYAPKK